MDRRYPKRQKVDVRSSTTAAPTFRTKLYFDWLSQDAALSLLRKISSRPRSPCWKAFVDHGDLVSVLSIGGPITVAVKTAFTGLIVNGDAKRDINVDIDTDAGFEFFRCICTNLSSSIDMLEFHRPWRSEMSFPNLTVLVLNGLQRDCDMDSILKPSSGKLRELDISGRSLGKSAIAAIARHCIGITKLSLKFELIQHSTKQIWEALGTTLEDLAMAEPVHYKPKAISSKDIAEHCKKLKHFSSHPGVLFESRFLRHFVCPLLTQLRALLIFGAGNIVSRQSLQAVIAECPQIAIDLAIHKDLMETLQVVGPRLRRLKLLESSTHPQPNVSEEDLRNATAMCTAIEELIYNGEGGKRVNVVPLFLSDPKPRLRSVELNFELQSGLIGNASPFQFVGWLSDMHINAAGLLAEACRNVEVLSIASPEMDRRVFRKFGLGNKRLRSIRVKVSHLGDWYIEPKEKVVAAAISAAVSLIQDVSVCPQLEEVVIEDECISAFSHDINEACFSLRGRTIDIFIGGIHYNA